MTSNDRRRAGALLAKWKREGTTLDVCGVLRSNPVTIMVRMQGELTTHDGQEVVLSPKGDFVVFPPDYLQVADDITIEPDIKGAHLMLKFDGSGVFLTDYVMDAEEFRVMMVQ
jgi:hypothetical protein